MMKAQIQTPGGKTGLENFNTKEQEKMKKLLALILAMAMLLSLAACGGGETGKTAEAPAGNETKAASAEPAPADGGNEPVSTGYVKDNLTVALSADGGTFDPFASFVNWGSASMTGLIFQGLIQTDYDYNVYYEMAKEITKIDDLHWELEIYDCIYDTAGNQITIDDVIWGYDQVIATGNMGAIPKFVKLEKTGDFTGVMELNQPFGDGDFEKHFGNVKVISRKSYEDSGSDMTTSPVGTGPYVLDHYTVGSEVVLRVNENYWGNNVPDHNDPMEAQNFETITYKIIPDASSRAIALEMGTVDVCDAMAAVDIDHVDTSKYNLITLPQRPPLSFVMNASEDSVLNSLELRQAILYGLDNAGIAASLAVPATPVYGLQPAMVDAPKSWTEGGRDYYNYNPEKAAELVKASGYNGEEIVLMYVSSTATDGGAIAIQSQLKDLGINIKLWTVDQTTAMQYQYDQTQWDIRLATLGGGAYLSQTAKTWWSEDIKQHVDGGKNSSMVADAKLDELYVALKNDASEANINAWAEYFDGMAYGYSVCSYANQTACAGDLQSGVLTSMGSIIPNTFVSAG